MKCWLIDRIYVLRKPLRDFVHGGSNLVPGVLINTRHLITFIINALNRMDKRTLLSQIQDFSSRTLTHVDTEVTTAAGKRVGGA